MRPHTSFGVYDGATNRSAFGSFYPSSYPSNNLFVNTAKAFHDKYAVNGIKMIQGETGLGYSGGYSDRMNWLKQLTSEETQKALPNYIGCNWFNYQKGGKSQAFYHPLRSETDSGRVLPPIEQVRSEFSRPSVQLSTTDC